jgi:hypothetical protein
MSFLLNMIHAAGPGVFPTMLFGAILIAVSVRYAIRPDKRLVPLLLSLNVVTVLAGGCAFVTGVITTLSAHAESAVVVGVGVGESLCNVAVALSLMIFGGLAVTVGAARVARQG